MDDKIMLYQLISPMSKRIVLFFLVVFPEACILSSLYFAGSKFMYFFILFITFLLLALISFFYSITSEKVSDLIINSVAIGFIMDIDNMAVEFFQAESVTEHVGGIFFETKMQHSPITLTTIEELHNREGVDDDEIAVDPEVIATFWTIEKVAVVLVISAIYVIALRQIYCSDDPNVDVVNS